MNGSPEKPKGKSPGRIRDETPERDCLSRLRVRYRLDPPFAREDLDRFKNRGGLSVMLFDATSLLPSSRVLVRVDAPGDRMRLSGALGTEEIVAVYTRTEGWEKMKAEIEEILGGG